MHSYTLTPADLNDNPALGILTVVKEGLHLADLALVGIHGALHEEPLGRGDQAVAEAFAFAVLFQMRALEDTISSYVRSVESLRHREEDDEEQEEEFPF